MASDTARTGDIPLASPNVRSVGFAGLPFSVLKPSHVSLTSLCCSTGSYASSRGKEDSAAAQMFPVARLLDAQKQAFEVQAELDEQKRTHAHLVRSANEGCSLARWYCAASEVCRVPAQEEGFQAREAALKKKDLELQESLVRFSKFLQENDAKRARANKKAIDERQLFHEKSVECQALVRPEGCPACAPSWNSVQVCWCMT